ncbi:glycoside hydrolase family 97 protein [Arcticibacter eurypsychrophilus]|uniref:glycoside hydrolase family 97 protein n=1 Tax=Arcticibacter eurypsychrophilus TaxID=1434752 RepID=UPI00084CF787|nr:glycoside hydrolase family 97 protein [Arcticibacter eurypsychrophilus]
MKNFLFFTIFLISLLNYSVSTAQQKTFTVLSPDKKIRVTINAGDKLQWDITLSGEQVIRPSVASLKLDGNSVLGEKGKVSSSKIEDINTRFEAHNYKKKYISDQYQQLTLNFRGGYSFILRAYNDGVAYRFVVNSNKPVKVLGEEVNFNFAKDYDTYVPYVRDLRLPGDQYISSFEALYDERPLSGLLKDSLAFLPILVDLGHGAKAAVVEAGLENYPGMYLVKSSNSDYSLKAAFARYPLKEKPGGYNLLNAVITERADYIAQTNGYNNFPWRAVIISPDDKTLLNNDMVQKLAAPSRIKDVSWIKPGKVAWDWWNDWNISHVNFRAGINTPTYKHYIDFASENKLEYVILDEGWSNEVDLQKISPDIALQELIDYGKQKNVGIILWAAWRAVYVDMEGAFKKYSQMGVKGFKIDFIDRDDQKATTSTYQIAKTASKYKLLIDLHGMYKPDGIQRTYPNVLNFEGVKGLENSKWTPNDDVPHYDVSIPFIRMLAGPLDYTPGAMRNAIKSNYRAVNSNPMSQGTRSHQVAMYVVFEAPIQMLADNPTIYRKEQESTTFISKIPTVFDETVALDGKVGEYAVIARKKGDTWYVGAMTNWDARDMEIDLSFLPKGSYSAEVFRDGINADRDATDYVMETIKASSGDKLKIHLSNGGGWAARIVPVK